MGAGQQAPLAARFYDRPVLRVAEELIGCVLAHGETSGVIVETEAYHQSEPACHAYVGLTRRTAPLFGPPGRAYVYRSYGIHSLLNCVCEPVGIGAAVLIRALVPLHGIELMRTRRGRVGSVSDRQLCSGPGKLTIALGVGLELNESDLVDGPVRVHPRPPQWRETAVAVDRRIGITKAAELPWRFVAKGSAWLSRPVGSG